MTKPELSVVIPVYNGASTITEQLDALAVSLSNCPPAEILVVNNRSTDETVDVVSRWSDATGVDLRIITADRRVGEPYARNVGFRSARSDIVAYCDADDVVGRTWAKALFEAMGSSDYATGPLDTHLLNTPGIADIRGQAMHNQLPLIRGLVPFANGSNMAFRRSLLESLGGFDETYLIGCDIEIAIRAWRAGIALVWVPDQLVHYRLRNTPRDVWSQARSYGRARRRIESLIPEVHPKGERMRRLRRVGWLVRHLPGASTRDGRIHWLWVAGQVVGEIESRRSGGG